MRIGMLIVALTVGFGFNTCRRAQSASTTSKTRASVSTKETEHLAAVTGTAKVDAAAPRVDFAAQIRPVLEARCQPCHFAGGTMYERLPFDRPATITTLGTKLFTRIKDENERRVVAAFLSQPSQTNLNGGSGK